MSAHITITVRSGGEISPSESEALGLAWREHYLVLGTAQGGEWMALITADVEYGRMLSASLTDLSAIGAEGRVDFDASRFHITLNDASAVRDLIRARADAEGLDE